MRTKEHQAKLRASRLMKEEARGDAKMPGHVRDAIVDADRIRFLRPKEKVPVYESTGTHRYDYPDWDV